MGDFATNPGKKLATLQLIADKVNAKLLQENKEAKTLSTGQVECVQLLVFFPIEFAVLSFGRTVRVPRVCRPQDCYECCLEALRKRWQACGGRHDPRDKTSCQMPLIY